MKYKLVKFNGSYAIKRISDDVSFLPNSKNMDYQKFLDDIYVNGIEIVEGANIQTQVSYVGARAAEYPPIEDQLDKIYHSGVNAWKADIKVIKDKYPKTQVGITTIEALPSWISESLLNRQKERYGEAKSRLAQYELSAGLKNEDGNYIIDPLPLVVMIDGIESRNPLVVKDEEERLEAQEVINKTPRAAMTLYYDHNQ